MPATRLIQAIVAGVAVITTGTGVAPFVDLPAQRNTAIQLGHADYMPLTAGRRLTYEGVEGSRFSLTFEHPMEVTWFDGTKRELIPVRDTRCGCRVLMRRVDGEVRAVGALADGRLQPWGEYIVVFPGALAGASAEPVETPAGLFRQAVRIDLGKGPVWFAPGVGIVKTNEFVLISQE